MKKEIKVGNISKEKFKNILNKFIKEVKLIFSSSGVVIGKKQLYK